METRFRIFTVTNDGLKPLPVTKGVLFSFDTMPNAIKHFEQYYSSWKQEVVILPVFKHTGASGQTGT